MIINIESDQYYRFRLKLRVKNLQESKSKFSFIESEKV